MDFSDERYVRVYVRDTVTWEFLEWEGQVTFLLLLRKVDYAGFLEFDQDDGPVAAVKAITRLPLEVVEAGLPRLLQRKVLEQNGNALLIVNYIEAQTTPHSDRFRSAESRARRRDLARHGLAGVESSVTKRDAGDTKRTGGRKPPADTKRTLSDTKRDHGDTKPVQTVTLSRAKQSQADRSGQTATAEDLVGSAPDDTPPQPQQPREPPEPVDPRSEKTPCPVDLWERMPAETKQALKVALVPVDAQEYLCRGFAARYAGRTDDVRRIDQWVASAVRAIQADWNDPRKRPKPPTTAQAGAGAGAPPLPRPAQDFSDPLSQRLLNRKIQ